ncbi:thioredoxin domain-containing protein [Candidatus Woesearchaeota archaeon]|nr:thioredoxin domain-containing protein [Candidatus Woesearchaeota archaeon]
MQTKVNWLEWGKESFEKAKKEDKPILLDLTAVWCHWCHVMDSTSYSDDECAEIINKDFIPIKVYIDKRPDIRERYNMGGFPSTVFLNSEGHIITGDTYIPPQRFKLMLENVKNAYKNREDEIKKRIIENEKIQKEKSINTKSKINQDNIKEILLSIEDNFDSFYGGFGAQPKFPSPEVLDLLFLQYKKTQNEKYLDMALKTLDGMYEGIHDKADFGFFRYSVTQDWKMPHYEKMLDTNAGLLRNYAVAFNITKNEKYKKIAKEIINYVNNFLSDQKNGGFYGSQDADEEFYHLKPEERKNKKQPYVDKTIYVDWNAMMISSYIKTGAVLNDDSTIQFAIKTVDFILDKCYDNKNSLFHFFDGKASINGLLSDNIYFLNCLIDTYFITQNQKYFVKIKEIAEFILDNFYDKENGGFYDKIIKEEDLGTLKYKEKQFLENSFSAIIFLRLYFLIKDKKYKQAAERTISFFADTRLNFSYFASMYAIAVDMLLNGEIKVDIFNRKDMINACIASNNPRVVVNFIDKTSKADFGYEVEGAYVCKGILCKSPIEDIDKLGEELLN